MPTKISTTFFCDAFPLQTLRRLSEFDPPVRILIDAFARRGRSYHRAPWRGVDALRRHLDRLNIDDETADRAVAELRRYVGLIGELEVVT